MVNQLIADIYDLTVEMRRALEEEDFDRFETLLEKRGVLMFKVETLKSENSDEGYSSESRRYIEATIKLDQLLLPQVEEKKHHAGLMLKQIKQKKQVSEKYSPYRQQTYGAFIDTNK